MEYDRYKFIVQCVIGEQKDEAVKMVCRCFWDSLNDDFAQDIFSNVGIAKSGLFRDLYETAVNQFFFGLSKRT